MGNPYIHYYLGQQDGRGVPVFKGSSWQTLPSPATSIYWAMSLPVKASNKQQEPVLWKARTPQRCMLYSERRGMLKPDEGIPEAAGVPPEREKHQEPNAQLKRERHLHLQPDVNRPSEREHLLETYSVKYEFRAQ